MTVRARPLVTSVCVPRVVGVSEAICRKTHTRSLAMSASVIYLTKAISIVVLISDASIRFPGVKEIESVRQGYGERNYRYRRQAAIQRGWTGR